MNAWMTLKLPLTFISKALNHSVGDAEAMGMWVG
jgi:hypothetical protein